MEPSETMTTKSSQPTASKLTFGFSKKLAQPKVLEKSAISDPSALQGKEETDFVLEVNEAGVKGTLVKEEKRKGPLVIPCKAVNDWTIRNKDTSKNDVDSKEVEEDVKKREERKERTDVDNGDGGEVPESTEDKAVQELLEEASKGNAEWDERTERSGFENLRVPLLMANRVPEGFEEDEGPLNVELRPEEATLEDYEDVPIEEYGLAMLRGMGWKAGEGIGKTRKGVAPPVEAALRPKGLGLGADKTVKMKEEKKRPLKPGDKRPEEEENLTLKTGAHIVIESGKHKDLYAVVEGLDEDNCRVVVKLTISGAIASIPQAIVNVVSRKDYEKYSKYLNKGTVDAYKEKKEAEEREKNGERNTRGGSEEDEKSSHKKRKKEKRERDDEHKNRDKYHRNGEKDYISEEKRKLKHPEMNGGEADSEGISSLWPHLRVRIISRTFKDGKYYNSKVVVEDVSTPTTCVCRTEDGKVLDLVFKSDLESVVPKRDNSLVRVIGGRRKNLGGKLAAVIERDKKKCRVVVRIVGDMEEEEQIATLDYDDVCEHVGGVGES